MIYDTASLRNRFAAYSNINQKISLEVKNGKLTRIRRGLYSDNIKIDAPILANLCYGPSYLSFEYALYHYGLIPEHVSVFTSACYGKKNSKFYFNPALALEYRSVPNNVFPYGVQYEENEEGVKYKIATKEKALCDTLYVKYPVRSWKDLKTLLFEDLRIDEEEWAKLDFQFIKEIAPLYHSNSINALAQYGRKPFEK